MMYGTAWKKDRTADLVYEAIKAGFRGIDTAAMKKHYDEALTGEGIRRAIREGIVSRRELFVRLNAPQVPSYRDQPKTNLGCHQTRSKPNSPP
jgi:diketogulonate reductase-like aldo/keto reductase